MTLFSLMRVPHISTWLSSCADVTYVPPIPNHVPHITNMQVIYLKYSFLFQMLRVLFVFIVQIVYNCLKVELWKCPQ